MGIAIKKISVKDLGPIDNFSASFGIFNLIYSKNERGKTFLTEFIIRSLFKNIKRWSYLRGGGKGKITVAGLEKQPVDFSPQTKIKLEDYWETSDRGLSLSMAKLLIVRGGEAGIEGDGGISKFLIKEVLSGINILDKIDDDSNIPKTVKNAEISDNKIIIKSIGRGKEYADAINELNSIEGLFEDIEKEYTMGVLKALKLEEKTLQDRLEQLNKAKRHLAYQLSEKIKKLESQLDNIPDEELAKIENEISIFRNRQELYSQLEKEYKDALEKSRDYKWLESALSQYKDLISKKVKKPGKFLLFLSGISAAAGIATSVLLFFFYASISSFLIPVHIGIICFCFLITLISSLVYVKKLNVFSAQAAQSEELNKISEEFKKRTGEELTEIALLESKLNEQREANSASAVLEGQINLLKMELKEKYSSIRQKIENFYGGATENKEWEELVAELKQNNKNIKSQIDTEKERLYKLGLSEEDYLPEDPGTIYSQQEYEKTLSDLEAIRKEIETRENMIQSLKYRICEKTRDDPSISWEDLIENLQKKRQEVLDNLKEISSDIIAGKIVHKIVSELHSEEDQKIKEGLQSEEVINPLKDITRRYTGLHLEGDNLIISDPYDNFDIKDLSTGAREQVMLALRIGFTQKLLKEDSLFLILDDAFQHSDWEKREILINKLVEIAKKGWQIIYLTMDDHIKELFDKTGKEFGADEYRSYEL